VKKDPKLAEDRLISGKLRAKAGRRDAKNTTVSVDGTDYVWASRPRHGSSGARGSRPSRSRCRCTRAHARADPGLHDEVSPEDGQPSDTRVVQALEPAIREAIVRAGIGVARRAFRYEVAESI